MAIIQLASAASISGTVRAVENDEPVYSASLQLINERLQVQETRTGIHGTFEFEDLPDGRYRLRIDPPHDTNLLGTYQDSHTLCESTTWDLEVGDQISDVTVRLHPGGTLSGQLLDPDHGPITDAIVWAIGAGTTNAGMARMSTSDSEGYFQLQGLAGTPQTTDEWVVWVDADLWPRQ